MQKLLPSKRTNTKYRLELTVKNFTIFKFFDFCSFFPFKSFYISYIYIYIYIYIYVCGKGKTIGMQCLLHCTLKISKLYAR